MPLAPFSPKAKKFFQRDPKDDKFFTLLEGSIRSGKTWAMMVKILSLTFYKVGGQRVLIGNSKESIRPIGLLGSGGYVDRFVPIDYGTANQTVFLDVIDDGNTYWVNDEWVWDSRVENLQKTDKQYADELEEWLADKRGALVIVDPSAASFKVEMTQRGIYHCDAVNDVLDGIRTVSSLLAQRKIKIHKRCTILTMQLQSYSWDEKAAKRGEEKPLKENDHTVDAIRYGMHTRVPDWRIAI